MRPALAATAEARRLARSTARNARSFHGAGCEIVKKHVGASDEARAYAKIVRLLEVKHDAALAAIQPGEVRGDAVENAVKAAGGITAVGPFDLDDIGSEVRKLTRAERSGDSLFERHHSKTAKG